MMSMKTKLLATAAAILLLIGGGGWAFARHKATAIARDQVDAYIIRYNLGSKVTYEDLSASPFGSATLSGVRLMLSPTAIITIASLDVSDIEIKSGQIHAISISAHGTQLPLLAIARSGDNNSNMTRNLVGMGYAIMNGDIGASVRYDDQRGTLTFESTGNVQDAGAWKARLSLAKVDPRAMNTLYSLPDAINEKNGLVALMVAREGIQGLNSLAIEEADISLDNSGIHERDQQVMDKDLPPDTTDDDAGDAAKDEISMVKAGMTPSEAHATREALGTWMSKGGTLKIATNLSQPLPLFRDGNLLTPAFKDPIEFLAETGAHTSN